MDGMDTDTATPTAADTDTDPTWWCFVYGGQSARQMKIKTPAEKMFTHTLPYSQSIDLYVLISESFGRIDF